MKFSSSAAVVALAATVSASPVAINKRQAPAVTDADILQFALTLEHLENVFYKQGLSSFPESDFTDAGFSTQYYDNLKYIAHDEESHVVALTAALSAAGASPVAACVYDFPFTDAKSFVTLASVLEGVGVSAYLGAAGLIASKEYLGVAGSILVTEALHQSIQRYNIGEIAPANPYGSALGLNEVYTLAATFIKSCPATNGALPVMAFPALTATQGIPAAPGITFTFSIDGDLPDGSFVTWVSGLSTESVPATMANGLITATIPMDVQGQSYALVTNTNVTSTLMDSQVLFGPAIVEVTPPSPTYDVTIQ
ncbi:hypothetical protein MMC09_004000 [Bachmanniomyces sp. S44760]|nr:hypothetical protein [Bachmanniomyces sp. S44760]